MTDSASIASLLLAIASSLEERDATASAGILRVGARRIVEQERQLRAAGGAREGSSSCAWCGLPIVQPRTGRPRLYHSDQCRRAAGRKGRKSKLEEAI